MLDIVQEYLARTGKTMVVVHGWDFDEDDIRAIKNQFEDEREEKKMLNFDKYRERIDQIIDRGGVPWRAAIRTCIEVTNIEVVDSTMALNWLFQEYKQPLLKNGDGLKPGDWIMVRDNEDGAWENRQFLAYFDGWFYARKIVPDGWIEKIDRFRQARLPEGGE